MKADECYPFGAEGDPLRRKVRTINDAPAEEVYAVARKLEQYCQKKAYETHREEFWGIGPDCSKITVKCPIGMMSQQYALTVLVQGYPVRQETVYLAIQRLCSEACEFRNGGTHDIYRKD